MLIADIMGKKEWSAFGIFLKKYKKDNHIMDSSKETVEKCGVEWCKLNDEEKDSFKRKARELNETMSEGRQSGARCANGRLVSDIIREEHDRQTRRKEIRDYVRKRVELGNIKYVKVLKMCNMGALQEVLHRETSGPWTRTMKELALVESTYGGEPMLVSSILVFPTTISEDVAEPIEFNAPRPTGWIQAIFELDVVDKERRIDTMRKVHRNAISMINMATAGEQMLLVMNNELEDIRALFEGMEQGTGQRINNVILVPIEELVSAVTMRDEKEDWVRSDRAIQATREINRGQFLHEENLACRYHEETVMTSRCAVNIAWNMHKTLTKNMGEVREKEH